MWSRNEGSGDTARVSEVVDCEIVAAAARQDGGGPAWLAKVGVEVSNETVQLGCFCEDALCWIDRGETC